MHRVLIIVKMLLPKAQFLITDEDSRMIFDVVVHRLALESGASMLGTTASRTQLQDLAFDISTMVISNLRFAKIDRIRAAVRFSHDIQSRMDSAQRIFPRMDWVQSAQSAVATAWSETGPTSGAGGVELQDGILRSALTDTLRKEIDQGMGGWGIHGDASGQGSPRAEAPEVHLGRICRVLEHPECLVSSSGSDRYLASIDSSSYLDDLRQIDGRILIVAAY